MSALNTQGNPSGKPMIDDSKLQLGTPPGSNGAAMLAMPEPPTIGEYASKAGRSSIGFGIILAVAGAALLAGIGALTGLLGGAETLNGLFSSVTGTGFGTSTGMLALGGAATGAVAGAVAGLPIGAGLGIGKAKQDYMAEAAQVAVIGAAQQGAQIGEIVGAKKYAAQMQAQELMNTAEKEKQEALTKHTSAANENTPSTNVQELISSVGHQATKAAGKVLR